MYGAVVTQTRMEGAGSHHLTYFTGGMAEALLLLGRKAKQHHLAAGGVLNMNPIVRDVQSPAVVHVPGPDPEAIKQLEEMLEKYVLVLHRTIIFLLHYRQCTLYLYVCRLQIELLQAESDRGAAQRALSLQQLQGIADEEALTALREELTESKGDVQRLTAALFEAQCATEEVQFYPVLK